MAENKKSFILYCDLIHTIEKLPDEKAGQLFKHILKYVNDKNPIIEDDLILELVFEPIKLQLKRDLVKFEEVRVKRSEAGKKSAELKAQQNSTNLTSVESVKHRSTNSTDNVNVNVNVNDNVNVNVIKENNIDVRKLKFADTLKPFLQTYGKDLLNDFFKYWTEPNKSNTKFKQELEKTWSLERRLETWSNNDNNFNKDKQTTKTNNYKQL
jgi:hypothetical protein